MQCHPSHHCLDTCQAWLQLPKGAHSAALHSSAWTLCKSAFTKTRYPRFPLFWIQNPNLKWWLFIINDLQTDLQWMRHALLHWHLRTCKRNNYYTKNRAMKAVFMKQGSKLWHVATIFGAQTGCSYHPIQKFPHPMKFLVPLSQVDMLWFHSNTQLLIDPGPSVKIFWV